MLKRKHAPEEDTDAGHRQQVSSLQLLSLPEVSGQEPDVWWLQEIAAQEEAEATATSSTRPSEQASRSRKHPLAAQAAAETLGTLGCYVTLWLAALGWDVSPAATRAACVQGLHTPAPQRKQAHAAPPPAPRKAATRPHVLSAGAPVRRLDFGQAQPLSHQPADADRDRSSPPPR